MSTTTKSTIVTLSAAASVSAKFSPFTAAQSNKVYEVLCEQLTNAASKAAQATNKKQGNFASCLVMQKPVKAATTEAQQQVMHIVQAQFVASSNKLTKDFVATAVKTCEDNKLFLKKDTAKFNRSLAKNYVNMCIMRLLNNMHVAPAAS